FHQGVEHLLHHVPLHVIFYEEQIYIVAASLITGRLHFLFFVVRFFGRHGHQIFPTIFDLEGHDHFIRLFSAFFIRDGNQLAYFQLIGHRVALLSLVNMIVRSGRPPVDPPPAAVFSDSSRLPAGFFPPPPWSTVRPTT